MVPTAQGRTRNRPGALACGGVAAGLALAMPLAGQERSDEPTATISPYGQLLAHVAVFDGQAELEDNESWLGLDLSIGEEVKFFATAEVLVALIQATQFNAGAGTGSGNLTLEEEDSNVFGPRLGLLGVDLGRAGRIALGKQESVYYDVASYAVDRLNVFGGDGTQAYTAGSDGGRFGTGRADQALTYRVALGERIDVGAQTQFVIEETTGLVDGVGVGAQFRPFDGLVIGASYNRAVFGDEAEQAARGIDDGDGEFAIVGIAYTGGPLEIAAVASRQHNGDAVRDPVEDDAGGFEPVFFDATGFELFTRWETGRLVVMGGLSYNDPDTDDPIFDPAFVTRYLTVGSEYVFAPNAYAYAEWRLDDSIDFDGTPRSNVLAVGMRYGFRVNGGHSTY
ncbi:MAG: hypothetical protein R3195_13820 [Gemmatimonadota bacterium]|nr:hypothetical protein [Gemmatimonadota bacterium]